MASFRDFTRRNRKRKSKLHAILVDQMRSMSSLYEIFQNEHGKCRSPPVLSFGGFGRRIARGHRDIAFGKRA